MIVIAKDGNEVVAKRELPDELGVPPAILVNGFCGECGLYHLVLFGYSGLHDDGFLYQVQKEVEA